MTNPMPAAALHMPNPFAHPFAEKDEDGLLFIHVSSVPNLDNFWNIENRLRKAVRGGKYASVIVTLPKSAQPLRSHPHRYQFERMVTAGGSQLCFVDYADRRIDQRGPDEAAFRRAFHAGVNSGLRRDYPAWPPESEDEPLQ